MRLDLSRLGPRQKAYAIGYHRAYKRAREEFSQEVRTIHHKYLRELNELRQNLAEMHSKYMTRLMVDAAVVERAALAPGTLLH